MDLDSATKGLVCEIDRALNFSQLFEDDEGYEKPMGVATSKGVPLSS